MNARCAELEATCKEESNANVRARMIVANMIDLMHNRI